MDTQPISRLEDMYAPDLGIGMVPRSHDDISRGGGEGGRAVDEILRAAFTLAFVCAILCQGHGKECQSLFTS